MDSSADKATDRSRPAPLSRLYRRIEAPGHERQHRRLLAQGKPADPGLARLDDIELIRDDFEADGNFRVIERHGSAFRPCQESAAYLPLDLG